MGKIHYVLMFLLSVIFISSCSPSPQENQATSKGSAVAQQLSAGINKGDLPPDFSINTIDGKQYRLSQFKEENKPVLLYFWATWCPFCSQDFDIVKNIYPKYADKVTFLAIDLDLGENAKLIEGYKDRKGIKEIDFAVGKESVLSDYAIKYTTTKYAIARNGLILYKGSGVFNEQQWEVLFNALVSS